MIIRTIENKLVEVPAEAQYKCGEVATREKECVRQAKKGQEVGSRRVESEIQRIIKGLTRSKLPFRAKSLTVERASTKNTIQVLLSEIQKLLRTQCL